MSDEGFDSWAILELMGHRRLAGRVAETTIAGSGVLRIDIPRGEAADGFKATQYYPPSAMYCLTPVSEEIARGIAKELSERPVEVYELPPALPRAGVCQVCGCTHSQPCYDGHVACAWASEDRNLCTLCATKLAAGKTAEEIRQERQAPCPICGGEIVDGLCPHCEGDN